MKDLIFITAYCTSEEQEKALERCVDSVIGADAHIALISHSHVPIHIQKKCQYYFYDYLNEISNDPQLLGLQHFIFGEKIIQSIFFNKYFYGFAIYRMFSIASQIGINYGYQNIHHIEYDCELLDKNLIKEHRQLLENWDSIIYTENGLEEEFMFGSFKSFKVSCLPENFKNYNRDFIEKELKRIQPAALEFLTKGIFKNQGNVLFRDKKQLNNRFLGSNVFYNRNLHYTLFYNEEDKSLNIFYKSFGPSENITILVNKERVVNLEVKENHWHIKGLGKFDEIDNVRIDNSSKILLERNFDQETREIYKNKSFICEKDN
jgi:hypothetical protein